MTNKLLDIFKTVPNVRKLSKAEEFIGKAEHARALSILEGLSWKPIEIDVMLMKAEALIGVGKKKEAAILLAQASQLISTSGKEINRKKILRSILHNFVGEGNW